MSAAEWGAPRRAVLLLFAVTLFVSAGLMFIVQPMVAKLMLPQFGGSPAIWSVCIVFFQMTLLLGYSYAYILSRFVSLTAQIIIHTSMLLLVSLSLPLNIGENFPSIGGGPSMVLLSRLVWGAGPVLFAIAATSPLLQSWFANLNQETARDPYFLYASSNAGSLLALLAYPFLVEPSLSLDQQATLWSIGVGFLIVAIALSGATTLRTARPRRALSTPAAIVESRWHELLGWILIAFVPSSLLLGATTYITTDVASAPLLWVMPLAIYLLTFVLVFARRPPLPQAAMLRLMPFVLIPLIITMSPGVHAYFLGVLILHLGSLFIVSMVLHGELAARRPPAERLTEFYFSISLGGVLGGMFNALLAPLIFPDVWEYPLALVAACLIRPAIGKEGSRASVLDIVLPLSLFALLVSVKILSGGQTYNLSALAGRIEVSIFFVFVPGLMLLSFWERRIRFAGGVAAYLAASYLAGPEGPGVVATARSFFGVSRVETATEGAGRYITLVHGTTLHGVRSLTPGEETLPMAYYSHEGPFGRFFAALPVGRLRRVGVIGLGAGDLACYAARGQEWSFYEIDPVSERLANDPRYFGFLRTCGNNPKVVMGDARLEIAHAPDAYFDLLILDAFSSDAIPIHLLTREALALYLRKVTPEGVLLFHLSSRNLDLGKVVGTLAADAGLVARLGVDGHPSGLRRSPTVVVAMARDDTSLVGLDWPGLPSGGQRLLWTDQRSDLLHVIRFTPWF